MNSFSRRVVSTVVSGIVAAIPGCAFDLARIEHVPVQLRTDNLDTLRPFTLTAMANIDSAPCNYDRVLKAGTRWVPDGEVDAGVVYHSPDQLLTFECSNVFEVYVVVQKGMMVGGYMPVERGYVALSRAVPLATDH